MCTDQKPGQWDSSLLHTPYDTPLSPPTKKDWIRDVAHTHNAMNPSLFVGVSLTLEADFRSLEVHHYFNLCWLYIISGWLVVAPAGRCLSLHCRLSHFDSDCIASVHEAHNWIFLNLPSHPKSPAVCSLFAILTLLDIFLSRLFLNSRWREEWKKPWHAPLQSVPVNIYAFTETSAKVILATVEGKWN